MIRALVHRLVPPRTRKSLRRFAEKLGLQHRFLRCRRPGYAGLRGHGIEIGAFEHPAPVPRSCRVKYVDVITPAQAASLFPEIDATRLVPIDYLVDLDREGLRSIADASQDFVIACHVIEHVANPGRFIGEMLRVLRPGGTLVIAAPDRDYTFDQRRPLTPPERLKQYYFAGRPEVGPDDYRDIIDYVHPEIKGQGEAEVRRALADFHRRREHLSVWTAASFREFLLQAFAWNEAKLTPAYEVRSDRNGFEYFGAWTKQ